MRFHPDCGLQTSFEERHFLSRLLSSTSQSVWGRYALGLMTRTFKSETETALGFREINFGDFGSLWSKHSHPHSVQIFAQEEQHGLLK